MTFWWQKHKQTLFWSGERWEIETYPQSGEYRLRLWLRGSQVMVVFPANHDALLQLALATFPQDGAQPGDSTTR